GPRALRPPRGGFPPAAVRAPGAPCRGRWGPPAYEPVPPAETAVRPADSDPPRRPAHPWPGERAAPARRPRPRRPGRLDDGGRRRAEQLRAPGGPDPAG